MAAFLSVGQASTMGLTSTLDEPAAHRIESVTASISPA